MSILTGIFGGSFNPIHNGHIQLAEALLRNGYIDEMWLLVSPRNPFKKDQCMLDEENRLEMACRAVAGKPLIRVSDVEFNLPRPSYMWKTLESIRLQYPGREFVLIIGADNWLSFSSWKHPEKILEHHKVLIYPRKGYPIDAKSLPENVKLTDSPLFPVSSTEIRTKIKNKEAFEEWLPCPVYELIKENNWYSE